MGVVGCCPSVPPQRWLLRGMFYLGSPRSLPEALGGKGLPLGKSPLSMRLSPPSSGWSALGEESPLNAAPTAQHGFYLRSPLPKGMGSVQCLHLLPHPFKAVLSFPGAAAGEKPASRETGFTPLLATRDWNSQTVDIDDKNPVELVSSSSQCQETGMITGTISQIRKWRLRAVNTCLRWHR